MSHFTEVKTKITRKTSLQNALRTMGFTVVEENNGVEVRGFFGDTIPAEFKILTASHYDIGFVKNEAGAYEVVGDWELLPKVSGIERESFMKHLKQAYARAAITEIAESKGYEIQCAENNEDGTVEMVVTQW